MFLRTLKLRNIRSYSELVVSFNKGKLLISGDIGSGKSSILMGIEFAFFGILSDLDGKALLRKGCSNGGVELSFNVEGKEYVVGRSLKEANGSVVQGPGFLVSDNQKIELTPSEIKSRIFEIFNYPKESSKLSKFLLFRFTVYTPQDSMKKILFDSTEERMSSIRNIFGIDKYKRIRENSKVLCSFLKQKIAVFSEVSKGLDESKEEKVVLVKKIEDVDKVLLEKNKTLELLGKDVDASKLRLNEFDESFKTLNSFKNELAGFNSSLTEKTNFLDSCKKDLLSVDEKLKEIDISLNQDDVNWFFSGIKFLEKHCEKSFVGELSSLKSSRNDIVSKVSSIQSNIAVCQQKIDASNKVVDKVNSVDAECPLCFRAVDNSHKEHVISSQQSIVDSELGSIVELKLSLESSNSSLKELDGRIVDLELQDRKILEIKNLLSVFNSVKDKLAKEFDNVNSIDISDGVDSVLSKLKSLNSSFDSYFVKKVEKDSVVLNKKRLENDISTSNKEIETLRGKIVSLKVEIEKFADIEVKYNKEKEVLSSLNDEFSKLNANVASLSSDIFHFKESLVTLDKTISSKVSALESLSFFKARLLWIEEWLVPVSRVIEREFLFKIFHELNSEFSNWFSNLIGFENYSASLNEDFSVSVVVDGYDIDVKNLSGGEKTACALAYRLAINSVVVSLNSSISTDGLFILDEPSEGFSYEQVDSMIESLNKVSFSQLIIVSHEKRMENFVDKVLSISKNGGKSIVG